MKRKAWKCKCGKEFNDKEKRDIAYSGQRCPQCRGYESIDEVYIYTLADGTETTDISVETIKADIEEKWGKSNRDKIELILIALIALLVTPIAIGLLLCIIKLIMFILYLIFKFIFWALF